MMVSFELVVATEFWDRPRAWPSGCRPVVFSTDLVMRNEGTMHAPQQFASEVEQILRGHPHVVCVARVVPGTSGEGLRSAA